MQPSPAEIISSFRSQIRHNHIAQLFRRNRQQIDACFFQNNPSHRSSCSGTIWNIDQPPNYQCLTSLEQMGQAYRRLISGGYCQEQEQKLLSYLDGVYDKIMQEGNARNQNQEGEIFILILAYRELVGHLDLPEEYLERMIALGRLLPVNGRVRSLLNLNNSHLAIQ